MNLKPAEEWNSDHPWSDLRISEARMRLYRQIQADALRWAMKRMDKSVNGYYEILDQANQLDPRPQTEGLS